MHPLLTRRNALRRSRISVGQARRTEINPSTHSTAGSQGQNPGSPASLSSSASYSPGFVAALAEYERELLNMKRAVDSELNSIRGEAEAVGLGAPPTFSIRHSILQFARFVIDLQRRLG